MKKIFKRVSAAVIALAVAATTVVFDVPGRIIASATSAPPHDIHAVCGDANCDEHQTISDWTWISGFDGISSGTYYIYDDVTLDDEVTIAAGTDITLCLNGFTITAASGKRIFNINGGSLTLCDCKGTGKLTGVKNGDNGPVYVDSSGTFTMYSGTISGNETISNGSAVYVTDGSFTMNGGTISDNTTNANGGGVYVSGGSFTMNGGTISGNTAKNNGGGVYVYYSGTFIMNGGTISDNTTSIFNGGGVYVSSGIFTMGGGTISGNTAKNNGGGVYVSSGTFTMGGGKISDNIVTATTSTSGGGGVYVASGTFTMEDGTISDNQATSTATANGGGVYVSGSNATFKMSGGTISGNSVKGYGGSVYVQSSGTFTMEDGIISDNSATFYGGGVYVKSSGTFTMEDGTISGNTAKYDGGGVYVDSGTFTMEDGTISDNSTSSDGGGVYVKSGTFTVGGGTISGNTAKYDGGGVYNKGTVTLSGKVDITGNKNSANATSNVYLRNSVLALGDDFSTDSTIGVNTHTAPTDCLTGTVAVTGEVSSDISGSFTPDVDGQVVVYKDNTVHLALPHNYSDEWSSDDTNHWHECTSCGDITDEAEHTFVDKSDETNHWQECSECGYKKDVTEHSWGDWSLTTEPTLTTTGAAERECSCGEKQTKTDVPALTDTAVWTKDEEQHVEPTEEAEGKDVYTSEYGKITITLDKPPHSLTHIDETPATETEEGVKEHWHCEGCGKNFADENGTTEMKDTDLTIPAIGHNLTHVPEVPATETTAGTKAHWHCSGCDKDFADEDGTTEMTDTDLTIPVIGHTHTLAHISEVPATETTAGTKEHWHCEGCGKDFADENGTTEMTDTDLTIPVIGHTHTLAHIPEVPATETTAGTKEHWHCEGCGKDFADANGTTEVTDTDLTIPVIGHTHTLTHVPEVPATETTIGTKEHWHCEGCGKDFADEDGTTEITDLTIPVIGHTHTLTHVPEIPATETTVGTKEHWHCDSCGKNFADEDGTQEVTADDLKIGKVEVQAPVNVEITTPKEELIAAALTEDEQQEIVKGTDIKIILKVENATENVSAEDKGMVETAIGSLNGHKLGQYLEVTLLKKIGEEQEQKITETNAPIKITFEISPPLRGKAEYSVIRVHNGTATVLPDLDSAPNTITIETDKFSTYALIYQENATPSNPSDSDNSDSTSSESKPNESDNSNTTSSSDSDLPSTDITHSGGEESGSSEGNTGKHDDNPSTGVTVSLIPLTAALAAVTVATKRKKK